MQEETEPWYSQKMYARYWKHYDLAMRWMHRHQEAYRKAMESFYHIPWPPYAASPSRRYSDWDGDDPPCTHNRFSNYSPRGRAQQYMDAQPGKEDDDREEEEEDSEVEEDSESEGEFEYDLSNMEITEELRQFFAQTERHREELRKSILVLGFLVLRGHAIESRAASEFTGFVTVTETGTAGGQAKQIESGKTSGCS